MVTVNETIGATGRDRATMTLWEANDGGGDGLGNDDCIGTCFNDSVFDETFTINFSANSIVLTVDSAERHDGTDGTGVRNVRTGDLGILKDSGVLTTIEWLEVDMNGNEDNAGCVRRSDTGNTHDKFANMLIHGSAGSNNFHEGIRAQGDVDILNNFVYDIKNTSTGNRWSKGINSSVSRDGWILNNTVHDMESSGGTGGAECIDYLDRADTKVQNNIGTDAAVVGGGSGTALDYSITSPSNATVSNNLSSDATAPGTVASPGTQHNKISANQFVSNSAPYDLHIVTGADAKDNGTDLATTPSGVEIDINGRDRDAQGDTWDMGAHEFVTVGGTIPVFIKHLRNQKAA